MSSGSLQNDCALAHHVLFRTLSAERRGDHEILVHGEIGERLGNLEGATDTGDTALHGGCPRDVSALKMDAALVRREVACDKIEQRGICPHRSVR